MNSDPRTPRLTASERDALVRLLAKATRAGCLPSVPDIFVLLDLIDAGRQPIAQEARRP
jgi:hypothetical protein